MNNSWRFLQAVIASLLIGSHGAMFSPFASGAAESEFHPSPTTARFCLSTEEWILWETATVVPGTEYKRAPTRSYRYFLQQDVHLPAQLVFSCQGTSPLQPVGVLTNGTTAFYTGGMYPHLLLVDLQGRTARLKGEARRQSVLEADTPLAAYDDGVLIRAKVLNRREPVYFVPWRNPPHDLSQPISLDFTNGVMITDSNGVGYVFGEKTFFRSTNLIAWAWVDYRSSSNLYVFNLADSTRTVYSTGRSPLRHYPPTTLQAFDGKTAIVIAPNNGQSVAGFDVQTGKQLPTPSTLPIIAIKHRVAYGFVRLRLDDKSKWGYALAAYDLTAGEPKPQVLAQTALMQPSSLHHIVREKSLTVWCGNEWKRFDWRLPGH